ncbi:hemolysin XhlA family protein [Synechocystis salina]|uniref:Hemolysin XhlA family protein n=1 Tax=Synechocystis salina LEGE 00031 TaxID=1828736 RepID=A0ABR9VW57_9SYNC|nr:hemolysin XhlA family protein [Synechocystis salina]MBE9242527.1 hemolysin XhlA family protein [Synechocystis salina LEGE 00041]MBE9255583.1 hemolysin XhlA family protein [Synechocystis salina LEGE 00031]
MATIETELKDVLSKIDSHLEKIDDRLGRLETGQARAEEKLDSLDKRVEKLDGSQSRQVWTLIGIIGTTVIGVVIRYVLTAFPNP